MRSEVRDYENGIEDDIYDYVSAAEYRFELANDEFQMEGEMRLLLFTA